ncbi:hypothetical protein NE865_02410 [Phthorimaea operculella]|nr:hypothetical protein NE865_02410 [Phthorimaea operculella]
MLEQFDVFLFFLLFISAAESYTNKSHPFPWRVRFYPKHSVFKISDLIDRGCSVFLSDCPSIYKVKMACARHYDGMYRTFNTYCDMEYENCNSWRQWSLIKHGQC